MTETIFKEFYAKKKISYGNIYVILFIVFCAILRKIIYKNKKQKKNKTQKSCLALPANILYQN